MPPNAAVVSVPIHPSLKIALTIFFLGIFGTAFMNLGNYWAADAGKKAAKAEIKVHHAGSTHDAAKLIQKHETNTPHAKDPAENTDIILANGRIDLLEQKLGFIGDDVKQILKAVEK